MSKQLTDSSTLDNLKKEAKRWLKSLRENDQSSWTRLKEVLAEKSAQPLNLRLVQLALAREYGFAGWGDLKNELESRVLAKKTLAELANQFLEYACADPLLANGPAAHVRRANTALRMLKRYPDIARHNIHTAIVCGDIDHVRKVLMENPRAAVDPGGPIRTRRMKERESLWTPLLHLCFGRLPTAAASENAVELARLLLDHGANANDYFETGSMRCINTALCGVVGEGEDDAPPHPRRNELARLLLEHGANPYDVQLFYNTHFHNNIQWILELIHEFSVKAGRASDWADPEWKMINEGGYGFGARYFLTNAINHGQLELAEWLLDHGANPNAQPAPHKNASQLSLYEHAMSRGQHQIAKLLERYGATVSSATHDEAAEFVQVCLDMDQDKIKAILGEHPEYRESTLAIFIAAQKDREDVVAMLLDAGVSIEIEDETHQRPLHIAAQYDSLRTAKMLVDRGADLSAVETSWNNTPLDFALYGNLTRMIQLLSDVSRDVFRLSWCGNVERLRVVLHEEPGLATIVDDQTTPLMWLPDDDERSVEVVKLFLELGADASVKSGEGKTAADYAERRGLYAAAELLRP